MPEERAYTIAHDDPSAQIWTSYLNEAHKYDQNLARRWKGDMDSILIFAGLFSASVTAFIIESYKTLSSQPADRTVELLAQISSQLSVMANNASFASSPSASAFTESSYSPATSAITCNTLWFLSLAFSLASALSATLVEQWIRMYLQATENRASIHERARISAYLYQGLRRFRMSELVETIPMLLHISLLLFFAGLVEFLRPVNHAMSYLILSILILCIALYCGATIIPLIQYDCPYRTPFSQAIWKVFKSLHILKYTDSDGIKHHVRGTMQETAERAALTICPERDERDLEAMSWTLKTLRQESELEAFVAIIPRAVVGYDYSAKLLLTRLLHHKDLNIRLAHRVPRLLFSCVRGVLDHTTAQKRAAACLSAMWSLCMMSVPSSSQEDGKPLGPIAFDEFTLRDIHFVQEHLPSVGEYTTSAIAVVCRTILDRHLDLAFLSAQELSHSGYIGTEMMNEESQSLKPPFELQDVEKKISHTLKLLEELLVCKSRPGGGVSSPIFMVYLNSIQNGIQILLRAAKQDGKQVVLWSMRVETLSLIHDFQSLLKQAGFALALEYASTSLIDKPMPHEVFNTCRRLVLRLDSQAHVPVELQRRYAKLLHDIFEDDSPNRADLPQSIVNLILGLSPALRDETLIAKAKRIISQSMHMFSSKAEAHKALQHLADCAPSSESPPVLDLFTSHMYSTIRPDRSWTMSTQSSGHTLTDDMEFIIPRRHHDTA